MAPGAISQIDTNWNVLLKTIYQLNKTNGELPNVFGILINLQQLQF